MTYHSPTTREVYEVTRSGGEQEDVERQFFRRLLLPNGTYKTTDARRLDDLNKIALPLIQSRPWVKTPAGFSDEPIRIMDVAISSGVSTIEWYRQLKSAGIRCCVTATDLTVYGSLITLTPYLAALIDRGQNILHLDIFKSGLPPKASGVKDVFGWMVRTIFRAAMVLDGDLPPLNGQIRHSAKGKLLKCTPITLLTKEFVEQDDLRVMEDDLMTDNAHDFKKAFHVLRAANILNRAYFCDTTLKLIVENLKERLVDGGLLIVCRTDEAGVNNATIFQLIERARLRILKRLNHGTEIEGLEQLDR